MNIAYRENISMTHQDASPYQHLEVKPLTGGLGAELFGADLGSALGDDVISEIRRALLQYQVIFFRDQEMTPEQHRDFGKRFGDLHIHEYVKGLDAVPEVMPVIKTEADMFANQYLAYETLSDGMKELLEGRKAVHSAEPIYGKTGAFSSRYKQGASMATKPVEVVLESQHPIFRTHPETGRKSLYVNGNFVVNLAGLSAIESAPILQRLYQHATTPEFCCRFRWRKGSVAFWDNRCVQHYAVNDYTGQRRVMHRVTVMGDQPY
jgi:taurine dioxygenase